MPHLVTFDFYDVDDGNKEKRLSTIVPDWAQYTPENALTLAAMLFDAATDANKSEQDIKQEFEAMSAYWQTEEGAAALRKAKAAGRETFNRLIASREPQINRRIAPGRFWVKEVPRCIRKVWCLYHRFAPSAVYSRRSTIRCQGF